MKKTLKINPPDPKVTNDEKESLQGYQFYPESEDIYNKFREEKNVDPEDISRVKTPDKSDNPRTNIGEESNDDIFSGDLDVPGSELDDEQENVGTEDEENNYYSIGGDDHNNLDENLDEL
jgi:hypothetical protein